MIQYLHRKIEEAIELHIKQYGYSELRKFDTVRGIFTEGGPAFEGAGIQLKNHIQVCIRNFNSIKGFLSLVRRFIFEIYTFFTLSSRMVKKINT